MLINGNLKFHTLGGGELQNAIMERFTDAGKPVANLANSEGRMIYVTDTDAIQYSNGTTWVTLGNTGAVGTLQTEVDAIETASGGVFDTDGTFGSTQGLIDLNALGNVTGLTGANDLLDVFTQLDSAISAAAGVDTLGELTNVTDSSAGAGDVMYSSGAGVWVTAAPGATSGVQPYDATIVVDADIGTSVQGYDLALDNLSAVTGTGILVQTGADTFITTSLIASAVAGDQGISLTDASGTGDAPTIGLDVVGLTAEAGTLSGTDVFAMYDGVNNVKASLAQIQAGMLSAGIALDDLSDVDDLALKDADLPVIFMGDETVGIQEVNVGGAKVGGDPSGLLNDATVYTASISVDGTPNAISIVGTAAQTYTTVLSEINADLSGAVASIIGGNIVITSSSTGLTSTIAITDTDLFSTLTGYVSITGAVDGAGNGRDTVTLLGGTSLTAVAVSGVSVTMNVDDDFLHNTGDVLDSGSLQIASGATIAVLTGADITAVDAPTAANDLTNKAYVDALVASGASWKNPVVDSDLVEITAANPGTMASLITAYSLVTGDNISFIASAVITFDAGGTTVVGTTAGDIVNLTVVSGTVGDYTLVETPLAIGDRFIVAAEHGTVGSVLGALIVADAAAVANADLIEYIGGTITAAGSWSHPDGRSGNAGGGTEIAQGVTVLNSDPDSVHYGHTFLYDQVSNAWVEISGPGSIGAGTGLSYTGTTLNIGMGAGIIALPADEVGIDLYDKANSALVLTPDAGVTRTGLLAGDQLYLMLDSTTLAQSSAGLKVPTQGITELELHTSVAGLGIAGGNNTALSFAPVELVDTASVLTDFIVMSDTTASGAPIKRLASSFLADLDIVTAAADGILVRTAADTFASRTLTASVVAGDEGISIVNGDGISGNPTIGLDIIGLVDLAAGAVVADTLLIYDLDTTTNKRVTVGQLADVMGAATTTGELSDVSAEATVAGQVIVATGAGAYTPAMTQYNYSSSGVVATAHTVNHALNQKWCNVTVLDASDEVIIPQSITFTDANNIAVVFNTAIHCRVVVTGVTGVAETDVVLA